VGAVEEVVVVSQHASGLQPPTLHSPVLSQKPWPASQFSSRPKPLSQ